MQTTTLVIRDSFDNVVSPSLTDIEAIVEGPKRILDVYIVQQDGYFSLSYFPVTPGQYKLKVSLHDTVICNTTLGRPIMCVCYISNSFEIVQLKRTPQRVQLQKREVQLC